MKTHVATNLDDYLAAELDRVERDYSRPVHGHTPEHVRERLAALASERSTR